MFGEKDFNLFDDREFAAGSGSLRIGCDKEVDTGRNTSAASVGQIPDDGGAIRLQYLHQMPRERKNLEGAAAGQLVERNPRCHSTGPPGVWINPRAAR